MKKKKETAKKMALNKRTRSEREERSRSRRRGRSRSRRRRVTPPMIIYLLLFV
jgi:hypothetical protein